MTEQTERQFQEAVIELARLRGFLIYHTFDSRRSSAGFPDLVLVKPPVALFIELKSQHGALRIEQTEWVTSLKACGLRAYVLRPSDWPTIEALLVGKPAGQVIDAVAPDELP